MRRGKEKKENLRGRDQSCVVGMGGREGESERAREREREKRKRDRKKNLRGRGPVVCGGRGNSGLCSSRVQNLS